MGKLRVEEFKKMSYFVQLKTLYDNNFEEIVKILKLRFVSSQSLFRTIYEFLRTRQQEG